MNQILIIFAILILQIDFYLSMRIKNGNTNVIRYRVGTEQQILDTITELDSLFLCDGQDVTKEK